ncbi:MAG: acyl-CoA/acyl-ACP dehydrogenase [Proteobacteria bacterium]|nr:acyl-CoA/acyl-ACP dehydrogenase [Pseudomonadota bacterium]
MSYRLKPTTEPGQKLCSLIEAEHDFIIEQAEIADAEQQVASATFDRLRKTGISGAFVPEQLGGMGLTSAPDWAAAICALARADASVAIALNMHLGVSRGMVDAWRRLNRAGHTPPSAMTRQLRAIAEGEVLICATATEPGTDNLHPFTEAVAFEEGYRINGHKMFVTLSPIATHLAMNLRLRDDEGDHIASIMIPRDTPGVIPQNDWDALGMRSSGSQSVRFEDCQVGRDVVRKVGPWGRWSLPVISNRTAGNLPLVAAFLGVAESAVEITIATLASGSVREKPRGGVVHMVAEMEIDLATCQALMARACDLLDTFLSLDAPTHAQAHEMLKDYQSAKWVINNKAIHIVNHAMDLVGGRSFMSNHRLARLYRDVRAGPFMQPFSRPEAREYVGRVALGDYPDS